MDLVILKRFINHHCTIVVSLLAICIKDMSEYLFASNIEVSQGKRFEYCKELK